MCCHVQIIHDMIVGNIEWPIAIPCHTLIPQSHDATKCLTSRKVLYKFHCLLPWKYWLWLTSGISPLSGPWACWGAECLSVSLYYVCSILFDFPAQLQRAVNLYIILLYKTSRSCDSAGGRRVAVCHACPAWVRAHVYMCVCVEEWINTCWRCVVSCWLEMALCYDYWLTSEACHVDGVMCVCVCVCVGGGG